MFCWTQTESKLQSLYSNWTISFYTYVQKSKPQSLFVQLKSRFRLDEQGREGERQENNPSDDCYYGDKGEEGKKSRAGMLEDVWMLIHDCFLNSADDPLAGQGLHDPIGKLRLVVWAALVTPLLRQHTQH